MIAAVAESLPYEVLCDSDEEPEWLSARFAGLGASEIGAVIGMDNRSSPLKLYLEKTGAIPSDDLSDVEAVTWGHILEPVIAEEFRKRTGRIVTRGRKGRYCVLRSVEHPWALASLDFWTGTDERDLWPLEIKNANAFRAEDWLNGTPEYHVAQLHQQMLVVGAKRGTSACLLGGNQLLWCDVERDETLIRKIIYHGARFWERVQRRDAPPPDGSQATSEALKKLYPNSDGSTVVLPFTAIEAADELVSVKEQLRLLEKRRATIENTVKAALGKAEVGVMTDGRSFSWKQQTRRAVTTAEATFRVLRLHDPKG